MSISGLGLDRFRFRLSVTTNAGLAAKRCIASAKNGRAMPSIRSASIVDDRLDAVFYVAL